MKQEQGLVIRTITGEGVVVDFEHFEGVEEAKDRCRENFHNNCVLDLKACDLRETGTCHQGSPCIIASRFR